jgi:hypothetical protein
MLASASRWFALLLGSWLLAAPVGAAVDAAGLIEQCVPRLDPARDVGVARILLRCPELERAWSADATAFGLPQAWREVGGELSVDALRELSLLLREAGRPAASGSAVAAPSAATLAAVLADWPLPDEASLGQRLLRWIRARIGVDAMTTGRDATRGALTPAGPGARLLQALGWSAFAAALVLVGWVLWREARASGWLRRRAGGSGSAAYAAAAAADQRVDDVPQRLQAGSRPSPDWWLAQLAARLAARGALRHPAGATAREIAAALSVAPPVTQRLATLVEVADEARFAALPPSQARLDAAAEAGRALLEVRP